MSNTNLLIVFYSTYGTNHAIAAEAAKAAEEAGASVRLRRIAETAPVEVVNSQDGWKAQAEKAAAVELVSEEDLEWCNALFVSSPTRYGGMASQTRAWLDTLGGLWMRGGLAGKTISAAATAQNKNGGAEGAIQQTYVSSMHFGMIPVAPGYGDPVKFEDGGNPYGFVMQPGELTETLKKSLHYQIKRQVEITSKIAS